MDKGPWDVVTFTRSGVCVMSSDFEHGVILQISGDFADHGEKLAYADWLAKTLNAALGTADRETSS